MKKLTFWASTLLLLLVASCQKEEPVIPNDSNNPTEVTPETSLVDGLAFINSEYEVFQYDTISIKQELRIFPADIASKVTVKFQSSDSSVATVNAKGEVIGVGKGKTVILATANGKEAKCNVNVLPFVVPQSLSLDCTTFKLITNGATLQLRATISPSNATCSDLEWISSNPSVATVSATGLVTPKSVEGHTIITCKHVAANEFDKEVSATCAIQVEVPIATLNFTETVNGVTFDMIGVEGGTFQMGATEEQGEDARDTEKPVHTVSLSSFYLSKTEVTQGLYQTVMGENPSKYKGDNLPVELVNWNQVKAFCEKLSQLTGKNYVLPTEAQWEYAARGGKYHENTKYAGSNNIGEVAWYGESWLTDSIHPVATKASNALGLYDMSGNMSEWCLDWYGDYTAQDQTNPTGPETGCCRVIRGGSMSNQSNETRVSCREYADTYTYYGSGFRIAMIP